MEDLENFNDVYLSPYELGFNSGYIDEYPECPFEDGTDESDEWWEGYHEGFKNG